MFGSPPARVCPAALDVAPCEGDMPDVGSRAPEAPRRNRTLLNAGLVLVLVAVFLTVGLPRFLAGDDGSGSPADADFVKVCRQHGGTPRTPEPGTNATAERRCTVRYGRQVYLMDAITPNGFDEDTANFQRQGCEEARREERAATRPGHRGRVFIYHPDTGVCEHRP
jgi:hypothetical protein